MRTRAWVIVAGTVLAAVTGAPGGTPPLAPAAAGTGRASPPAAAGTGAPGASGASLPADAAPMPDVLGALPGGPPPAQVPYGIGTRIFFAGHGSDQAARFAAAFPGTAPSPDQRQFTAVVGGAGFAWTQITGSGADAVHRLARIDAAGRSLDLPATVGRASVLAVTTSGLVAEPENGHVLTPSGAFGSAFTGSAAIDCGSCAPTAAGPRLVIDQWTGVGAPPQHQATWLWEPPSTIRQLDDRFRAVGRLGTGWLALRVTPGCWQVAPSTAPERLGPAICSLTTPLVSADGRRAAVVRDGRVLVVDPLTGATLRTASMGRIAGWSPGGAPGGAPGAPDVPGQVRYAVPAVWESDDAFLVTVRVDRALALVRCSAGTGECRRAVTSVVRPGVDRIVTERGPADAILHP